MIELADVGLQTTARRGHLLTAPLTPAGWMEISEDCKPVK